MEVFPMMEKIADDPFDELPEALVEEMLNQCDELGETPSRSFCELSERKSEIRENMANQNLLKKQTLIDAIRTTRKYDLGWMETRIYDNSLNKEGYYDRK